MANTRFAYVRSFELPDMLLPSTYIVCRIDGRGFHRFSEAHGFTKPNDEPALELMDRAALGVMRDVREVVLGFGESDEYSFLLRRDCNLYNRRESKILSLLISLFTSHYVFHWHSYFPSRPLQYPPSFDGRIVLYPSAELVQDYFAWRQADTHINNLYNTTFWALVQQGGLTTTGAHAELRGTVSSEKHEVLHRRFGINYNDLPQRFRKGSVLVRRPPDVPIRQSEARDAESNMDVSEDEDDRSPIDDPPPAPALADSQTRTTTVLDHPAAQQEMTVHKVSSAPSASSTAKKERRRQRRVARKEEWDGTGGEVEVLHCDIIGDDFWILRPWLLK